MIDVTLLGTAATLPQPDRALTAAALSCQGRALLFDCGEGTQLALNRCHVNPRRIDAVCLTHFHGDHLLGLPGLLQALCVMDRTDPLYIIGPEEGFRRMLNAVLTLADELPYPVRPLVLPPEGIGLSTLHPSWPKDATLTPVATKHRVPSQGYLFRLGRKGAFAPGKARALHIPPSLWRTLQAGASVTVHGQTIRPEEVAEERQRSLSVLFTGDTEACEAVEQAARNVDLLMMDATYAEDRFAGKAAQFGHSTFAQTAALAARANARALWLMHYSARIADPEALLPIAQAHFPDAQCGRDGLRVTLTFSK